MNSSKTKIFYLSAVFFFIYLFLPTRNSTIDAWCFAANVKQCDGLFLSHHLFYNAIGFIWVKLIGSIFSFDTLKLLIALNALLAASTLYILGLTLRMLETEGKRIFIWIAFAGSSWAIMRFATENETYIIPLFFSILGSYYFLKSLKEDNISNYIYSGLFAATACLFHQVMFFWWISLLIGFIFSKKVKSLFWFTLPALTVPISYLTVLVFYYDQPFTLNALMHFVFNDYYSGAAGISTGISSLIFTPISIIRSFFQVHGYLTFLPQISRFFIVGGILSIGLIVSGLICLKQISWKLKEIKNLPVVVHLLALFLQLAFAFLSSGNAEFMVMIPLLLAILLPQIIHNEVRVIGFISAGMLIWNVTVGLIPLNHYILDSSKMVSEKILEGQQQKKKQLFVLFNKPRVENQIVYHTGNSLRNIITGTQYKNIIDIKKRIVHALENDSTVLTDCINRPSILSRETMVVSVDNANLFGDFNTERADSIQTLTGEYYLYQISLKK
jgi:hypothetical protein